MWLKPSTQKLLQGTQTASSSNTMLEHPSKNINSTCTTMGHQQPRSSSLPWEAYMDHYNRSHHRDKSKKSFEVQEWRGEHCWPPPAPIHGPQYEAQTASIFENYPSGSAIKKLTHRHTHRCKHTHIFIDYANVRELATSTSAVPTAEWERAP